MSSRNQSILIFVLTSLLLCACQPIQVPHSGGSEAPEKPESALFLGNSFTYFNGGIENHVKSLAESDTPPKLIEVDSVTMGGATLKTLYNSSATLHTRISDGDFDVVVLQGDIPEIREHTVDPFLEHARLLDQEISEAGSATVFFMTWPYQRLDWVTLDEIVAAHQTIGTELQAPVAPVGLAFERAEFERPDLAMLSGDKEHESMEGTYLAANVLFATLFGESPEGLAYRPTGVSDEDAAFLQRIAWETVQEWQNMQ